MIIWYKFSSFQELNFIFELEIPYVEATTPPPHFPYKNTNFVDLQAKFI